MERRFDILVVGSGIAGLFYAIKAAELNPGAKIAIITKKAETDTSTNRAQGGIAAVLSNTDSFDKHFADTIRVGGGLCDEKVVTEIVEAGPGVIEELIQYGVRFTQHGGEFDLGREGGHSDKRVVHADDLTGKEIERALLIACRNNDAIHIFRDHMVLDLITYHESGREICAGVFAFSDTEHLIDAFFAPVTMLATGGLGQIYFHNTNPRIATGDGVAIAYRAGVSVANLEFIQFHPTALYLPGRMPFLISEAVRGEGARLLTADGRELMEGAHELRELAPRDVVARAIDRELKESGGEFVLLDISHKDPEFVKSRFPNIYKECLRRGFDLTDRPVPVVPSAHYACGGVMAAVNGETSIPGLYCAGEVAMSGMHGANRLASNSLLEAVVMAERAARTSTDFLKQTQFPTHVPVDNPLASSLKYPRDKMLIAHDRRELTRVMSDFVGIVRTTDRLLLALDKVHQLSAAIEEFYLATPATYNILELRNMTTVAELIIKSALSRHESRGLHFIEDYPETSEDFLHDTIFEGLKRNEVN